MRWSNTKLRRFSFEVISGWSAPNRWPTWSTPSIWAIATSQVLLWLSSGKRWEITPLSTESKSWKHYLQGKKYQHLHIKWGIWIASHKLMWVQPSPSVITHENHAFVFLIGFNILTYSTHYWFKLSYDVVFCDCGGHKVLTYIQKCWNATF